MSKVTISGANFSSEMLKIPMGIKYPFQFRLDFDQALNELEIAALLEKNLKLQIYRVPHEKGESFIYEVSPIQAGNDVLFILDTEELERNLKKRFEETEKNNKDIDEKVRTQDHIYEGVIVQFESRKDKSGKESFKAIDTSLKFHFQTIKYSVEKAQLGALAALEQLPGSLKNVEVSLKPSFREDTADEELWGLIRKSTTAISYKEYEKFMNGICGAGEFNEGDEKLKKLNELSSKRFLPFTDTDSYRTIKVLTEFFLLIHCTAKVNTLVNYKEKVRFSSESETGLNGEQYFTIPFLNVIRNRMPELRLKVKGIGDILDMFANPDPAVQLPDNCFGILQETLSEPCFIELIWSYWHEEAMLVQTLNAISLRFQNRKSLSRSKDPLASMEISPLKPLNNLLWGYIQDEQHRLTVVRRAYEYDHHYGITLQGKAVPDIQGADSRKNFLEAFHMLLYRCILFYKQDDDLTVKADAFPILNALKEVHYILSEGMHNQYGDLPFTARVEMLSQQWLLARPELREFLPTRAMVAYPETWMGPLSAMNNLQGWTGTSPTYFNMLAVYGEMLFLSVRFGNWSETNANADQATNWAREFRPEIQGYIHAYRTVTGVELTTPHPQTGRIDSRQPSFHLVQRAKASLNGSASNGNGQVKVSSNGKSTVGY